MKNVDFNAIVFKFVTPLLLFQFPGNVPLLIIRERGLVVAGIQAALAVLLMLVCCIFGVRKEPETEETRKVSEFLFRLFGLYQTILALGSFPWIIQFLLDPPPAEIVWAQAFPPEPAWYVLHLLFAVTLLTIPNVWNRLIVLVGRFLRRY